MKLNQLVPELPVSDVEKARDYYCTYLGCKKAWLYPDKSIGAVSNDEIAIFLRKRDDLFQPAIHWVFCENVDDYYQNLKKKGAQIVDNIEDKPWGMRQFTVQDLDANIFYFHG